MKGGSKHHGLPFLDEALASHLTLKNYHTGWNLEGTPTNIDRTMEPRTQTPRGLSLLLPVRNGGYDVTKRHLVLNVPKDPIGRRHKMVSMPIPHNTQTFEDLESTFLVFAYHTWPERYMNTNLLKRERRRYTWHMYCTRKKNKN